MQFPGNSLSFQLIYIMGSLSRPLSKIYDEMSHLIISSDNEYYDSESIELLDVFDAPNDVIKELVTDSEKKQSDIASEMGIDGSVLSRWIKGERNPNSKQCNSYRLLCFFLLLQS